jgi:CRISPR-associated protein Cmr6
MPNVDDVPMMFRASVNERCKLQYAGRDGDVHDWKREWLDGAAEEAPSPSKEMQVREYQVNWRYVTNGGKDDGIIRPVLDSMGMPFYPGSSMKGLFRAACRVGEKAGSIDVGSGDRYCGTIDVPGILRFQGGYAVNNDWKLGVLDLTHPQQDWQVKNPSTSAKEKEKGASAFSLISLYQPMLQFRISGMEEGINWETVWKIWEIGLGLGLGCRVSAGYGVVQRKNKSLLLTGDRLFEAKIKGMGSPSKRLDGALEFRPNIFRAAIRGHALRIFSGLNVAFADRLVDELFGGISKEGAKCGLLRMVFHSDYLDWRNQSDESQYDVSGQLIWVLASDIDRCIQLTPEQCIQEGRRTLDEVQRQEQVDSLKALIKALTQFAMLMGGFGKSWRRSDHKKFFKSYTHHQIGCHWEWGDAENSVVKSAADAEVLIKQTIAAATDWMQKRFPNARVVVPEVTSPNPVVTPPASVVTPGPVLRNRPVLNRPVLRSATAVIPAGGMGDWRERWMSNNVRVFCCVSREDKSIVIPWLHGVRDGQPGTGRGGDRKSAPVATNAAAWARPAAGPGGIQNPGIKRSVVTGMMQDQYKTPTGPTQIGRLWHRMYPLTGGEFLEMVTVFYGGCGEAKKFVEFLEKQPKFKELKWGTGPTS